MLYGGLLVTSAVWPQAGGDSSRPSAAARITCIGRYLNEVRGGLLAARVAQGLIRICRVPAPELRRLLRRLVSIQPYAMAMRCLLRSVPTDRHTTPPSRAAPRLVDKEQRAGMPLAGLDI